MKIVDRDGKTLGACAVFEHRGYEISCSTLPTYGEIAVFHPSLGFLKAFTATPKGVWKSCRLHQSTSQSRSEGDCNMTQIPVTRTPIESLMRSAAFVKGYKDVQKGKPYNYEVFTGENEIAKRWQYERGRQFGLIYNGNLKNGQNVTRDAQEAIACAYDQKWVR